MFIIPSNASFCILVIIFLILLSLISLLCRFLLSVLGTVPALLLRLVLVRIGSWGTTFVVSQPEAYNYPFSLSLSTGILLHIHRDGDVNNLACIIFFVLEYNARPVVCYLLVT